MHEAIEKTTCRQPFNFRRFLKCLRAGIKWFLIILLVELLVIGVMLHISWKVFLLILCLIGMALIPKRIRKYNYIPIIILLSICIVWVLTPDGDRTWTPFTFDVELAQLESQYTIDDEDNAAAVYKDLIEQHKDTIFHPNIFDFNTYGLDLGKPFSTESYPELSKMITDQNSTISELLKAGEYDKCHFAVPHDMAAVKEQHQRIFIFKGLCRLLLYSANNDIGDGRFDQGITKQLAVLKIADHLYQQQTLFDNSAAAFIELTALQNINTFVMRHSSDGEYLDRIVSHLKLTDEHFPDNWPAIYASLNLLTKNMVAMLYEIHPDGRIRRSHTIAPTINRQFKAKMRISPFQMSIVKAGAIGHWLVLPGTPKAAADIIDTAFNHYSPTASVDLLMAARPKLRLNFKHVTQRGAHYCGKWYYSIKTQSQTSISAARASTILIALKRYHLANQVYPDSLEQIEGLPALALIDTVNGQAFIYKKTGDDFLLYSTGRNKIDDGGTKMPALDFDDVRAWPPELPSPPSAKLHP